MSSRNRSRHVTRLKIGMQSLLDLAAQGYCYKVIENGIPRGSKVVGAYVDTERMEIILIIERKSFIAVKEGDYIPEAKDIVVERISNRYFKKGKKECDKEFRTNG